MTPGERVTVLRVAAAANRGDGRRPDGFAPRHIDLEDEVPEPTRDPFPKALRYGEHRCICGGAAKRHASQWWCTNPALHPVDPVANEVDR